MKSERLIELRQAVETGTRREAIEAVDELIAEIRRLQRRRDAAKGPTLSEVMTYAAEIGLNSGEPEKFHDYHTARGWRMGKTASAPMRDWRAALRLWKRNAVPVAGKTDEKAPLEWPQFLRRIGYDYTGEYKHAPEYMRIEFAQWKRAQSKAA